MPFNPPLLARLLESDSDKGVLDKAREMLAELLLPRRITGEVVARYVRKAQRNGAWRALSAEGRALLLVARLWGEIRSPLLKRIICNLLVEVELHTTRGKAVFHGLLIQLKRIAMGTRKVALDLKTLLVEGLSYINRPLLYRSGD
jgi:hypothetical protein